MTARAMLRLAPTSASAARARDFVRGIAPADVDADDLVLMVSELVANVTDHARTDSTLVVEVLPRSIRVTVQDGQAASDTFKELIAAPWSPVPVTSHRGRGLAMVKVLATQVGLRELEDGKAVWFEIARRRDDRSGA